MRVPFLIARIREVPIGAPTPTDDHVKIVALGILLEVVVKPEELCSRLNIRKQATVLKGVDINKVV